MLYTVDQPNLHPHVLIIKLNAYWARKITIAPITKLTGHDSHLTGMSTKATGFLSLHTKQYTLLPKTCFSKCSPLPSAFIQVYQILKLLPIGYHLAYTIEFLIQQVS